MVRRVYKDWKRSLATYVNDKQRDIVIEGNPSMRALSLRWMRVALDCKSEGMEKQVKMWFFMKWSQ